MKPLQQIKEEIGYYQPVDNVEVCEKEDEALVQAIIKDFVAGLEPVAYGIPKKIKELTGNFSESKVFGIETKSTTLPLYSLEEYR